jgi:hypothetical protein
MTADSLVDAAVELATRGWAVFPCLEQDTARAKAPYTKHGFKDATRDGAQITAWWRRWPSALIGAPVPASLLVLDIDPRHCGSLDVLEAVVGLLPVTLTVWSGRGDGGRHLYFRRPLGRLTSTALPAGIDLKAAGGYCILPPSRHPSSGQPYRWEQHHVAALPERAVTALRPAPRRPLLRAPSTSTANGLNGLVRVVLIAREGNRNAALYWACRRAVERGAVELSDLRPLIEAAHRAGLTASRPRGMTEAEVTAVSALRGAGMSV